MRRYIKTPNALPEETCQQILGSFVDNLLIGSSPLRGPFHGTRGVAWTFTLAGLPELLRTCPWLSPALEALSLHRVHPRPSLLNSLPGRRPFNAFYLNLLQVAAGDGVRAHVDTTLREAVALPHLFPRQVSVLWLTIPPGLHGGELRLFEDQIPCATLSPGAGDVVHFNGKLLHQILPLHPAPGGPNAPQALRTSLVCEKYRIPKGALRTLPPLRRHSRGTFARYLARARTRPRSTFEVESPPRGSPPPPLI